MTVMENSRSHAALIQTAILAVLLVLALGLSGCRAEEPTEPATQPTVNQTEPEETEAPTAPPPTAPADGNADDVTCLGSYNASNKTILQQTDRVVATMGEDKLTLGQLQIYYAMAIRSYRAEQHQVQPDYTQPLDVQLCEIDDTAVTWQQYFLQCALNSWRSYVAMNRLSQNTVFATEAIYKPDAKRHTEYLNKDMPAMKYLYGYNMEYEINELHQQYLDNLPTYLYELAKDNGFADVTDFLRKTVGMGVTEADLLDYADLANRGYMLLTALSYRIEPTAQEVEQYFADREAEYNARGITRDSGYYVDARHILLVPQNAVVGQDGTVTCSQEDWDKAEKDAKSLLAKWKKNATVGNFADLAFAQSADAGSSLKGGLYSNIAKGQLTEALDNWFFDPNRKVGDVDIVRTDCGYHLVCFGGKTDIWYRQAEQDLIGDQLRQCIRIAAQDAPMEVSYGKILLNDKPVSQCPVSAYDIVYHDIAHQRFLEAPVYLQQDYPGAMYGNYPLDKYGCGITTMAMLATYMTDEEWTPPEMASRYGRYCFAKGTAHVMLNEVPTDMGFFVRQKVYNWTDAHNALKEGYMVITLQQAGFWTRGGHYLLLHHLNEDGKLVVRDSNIGNYMRLAGHQVGYFDTSTVPPGAKVYWIYQKKVTRIPMCVRCGENREELPLAMFEQDYYCPKCQTAMHRRLSYIDGCAGIPG